MKLIEKLVGNIANQYDRHLRENNIRDNSRGAGFKNWIQKEYHLTEEELVEYYSVLDHITRSVRTTKE